jgi:hypothetical protein
MRLSRRRIGLTSCEAETSREFLAINFDAKDRANKSADRPVGLVLRPMFRENT